MPPILGIIGTTMLILAAALAFETKGKWNYMNSEEYDPEIAFFDFRTLVLNLIVTVLLATGGIALLLVEFL